jgi:Asp-tRNA(Asn)/Glu-tRNA(Gln) amidotransferase C subunit
MTAEITIELVRQLARVANLHIPDEDLEDVRDALAKYHLVFAPVEALDLTDVDPALTMDPRWPEEPGAR